MVAGPAKKPAPDLPLAMRSANADACSLLRVPAAPQVLRLLRESEGNILDDEQLVATLNSAKATSGESWSAQPAAGRRPLPLGVLQLGRHHNLLSSWSCNEPSPA